MPYNKLASAAAVLISVLFPLAFVAINRSISLETGMSDFVFLSIAASLVAAVAAVSKIRSSRRLEVERVQNRVVIIYSRKDEEAAREYSNALERLGFNPWLDQNELKAGDLWKEVVTKAVATSAAAIVLVSKNFSGSPHARKELQLAMDTLMASDSRSPVIPVLLDDAKIPTDLHRIQWLDARHGLDEAQLGTSLKALLDAPQH